MPAPPEDLGLRSTEGQRNPAEGGFGLRAADSQKLLNYLHPPPVPTNQGLALLSAWGRRGGGGAGILKDIGVLGL